MHIDNNSIRNRFDEAVFLIAYGLCEKEHLYEKNPRSYPYSQNFRHGLNIYASLCAEYGTHECVSSLAHMSEASFILNQCTHDVIRWTANWKEEARQVIENCSYAGTGPLAYIEEDIVLSSDECLDLLVRAENDTLGAFQERRVYEFLKDGSQEQYVLGRLFLVRHPLLNWDTYQRIKTRRYDFSTDCLEQGESQRVDPTWMEELVALAYEQSPRDAKVCSHCGWTITKPRLQTHCSSPSCALNPHDFETLPEVPHDTMRLSKGIMRYISRPGALEIQVAEEALYLGLPFELWPAWDTCDILITLQNGTKLAIDAKDYSDARRLSENIASDTMREQFEAAEGIYVIPNETHAKHPEFATICNEALKGKDGYSCMTLKTLSRRLKTAAKEAL